MIPAKPEYVLRSPDSTELPFPEILSRFTNAGSGWVDLRPRMELRVENAYYREGVAKRGLTGFLGTEIARYQVRSSGALRQISIESKLTERPADQPPVQQLLRASHQRYRHQRFFYQVLLDRKSDVRSAVLLGAASTADLDRLTRQLLTDPDSVCGGTSPRCTAFPEACTVSLGLEIIVNGTPRTVSWGSNLASIVRRPQEFEVWRLDAGRLVRVELDANDPGALRLPLLPDDRITWR